MSAINVWKLINTWLIPAPPGGTCPRPLTIATHGLLNSPLAVAAVRGHLCIGTDEAIQHGSGITAPPMLLPHKKLERQLRREDEEVLAVIIAWMETKD